MKSKATALALMVFLSTGLSKVAFAEINVSERTNINVDVAHDRNDDNISTSTRKNDDNESGKTEHANSTSSERELENSSTTSETHGSQMSETHRSVVASFVHSLLNVADREGGIGSQVRVVAQSQNESASTTAEAMVKVESRGALHTFLVGSDYKNLGVIRNEVASTTANLLKLKTLLSQATNDADKAELNAQITALETEQSTVEAYVSVHENAFSLFGWLNKLFNK